MTNAEQIAALERTLADVENGISLIEARLAAGGPGSAGLTATLANLRARRTALQLQIANLRAAGVTVAPLAAPAPAAAAAAGAGAGAPRAAAPAPLPPKALLAFAKNLDRFAKSTLDVIGGKRAPARRASKSKAAKGSKTSKTSKSAKKAKTSKKATASKSPKKR